MLNRSRNGKRLGKVGWLLSALAFVVFPQPVAAQNKVPSNLGTISAAEMQKALDTGLDPNYFDDSAGWTLLEAVVEQQNPDVGVIRVLVKAGARVDEDSDAMTALAFAARDSTNPEVVDALLDAGADAKLRCFGLTAAQWGARNSNLAGTPTLKRLQAAAAGGSAVSSKPKTEGKSLFDIVQRGTLQELKAALQAGADVNEKFSLGNTPLLEACMSNPNPDVIIELIRAGADVTANIMGDTALALVAPRFPDASVINALIKAGVDPNAKNLAGETALIKAGEKGTPPVIAALLKAGADPSAKTLAGFSAFDAAQENPKLIGTDVYWKLFEASGKTFFDLVKKASARVVGIAIAHGANTRAPDSEGMTPLMYAAQRDADVVQLILKAKADPNAQGPHGVTALLVALNDPNDKTIVGVISALLVGGAKPGLADENGTDPLMMAARFSVKLSFKSAAAVTDALLKAGAPVNAVDRDGKSALIYAVEHGIGTGTAAVVSALLRAGIRVDAADKKGVTALMYAAQCEAPNKTGAYVLVPSLLKAGAKLDARDAEGMTPLLWAARGNENPKPMEDYLARAGADRAAKNNAGDNADALEKQSLQSRGGV